MATTQESREICDEKESYKEILGKFISKSEPNYQGNTEMESFSDFK